MVLKPIAIKPKQFIPDANGFSMKHFYTQYGRYHFDKTNVLLHLVGIPMIVVTTLALNSEVNWWKLLKLEYITRSNMSESYVFTNNIDEEWDICWYFWFCLCLIYCYVDLFIGVICFFLGSISYVYLVGLLKMDRSE